MTAPVLAEPTNAAYLASAPVGVSRRMGLPRRSTLRQRRPVDENVQTAVGDVHPDPVALLDESQSPTHL